MNYITVDQSVRVKSACTVQMLIESS